MSICFAGPSSARTEWAVVQHHPWPAAAGKAVQSPNPHASAPCSARLVAGKRRQKRQGVSATRQRNNPPDWSGAPLLFGFILSIIHGRRCDGAIVWLPAAEASVQGSCGVSAIQRPAHLRHSLSSTAAISSDVDVARDDTAGRGGAGEVNSSSVTFCECRAARWRRGGSTRRR